MPLQSTARRAGHVVFAIALLLSSAAGAEPAAVRLRWRASPDPSVVGYHVHVRPLDGTYGTPRDAGLPPVLPDGTMSVVVGGLDRHTAYALALSAYTADGVESALSNELTMTVRRLHCARDADCADNDACTDDERCEAGRCRSDPHVCAPAGGCSEAVCDATAGCLAQQKSDGAACTEGDPCASGTCAAGSCVIPPEASAVTGEHDLAASRFVLRRHRRSQRLSALGAFAAESFAPLDTGAVVQVFGADGGVLFEADVPARALHAVGRRSVRYRPGGTSLASAGLRRLVLRWDGTIALVSLEALVRASTAANAPLTWALRTAGMCVRAPDLVCQAAGPRAASCR